MKSLRKFFYCIGFALLLPINLKAQISAGIQESSYIYGKYSFSNKVNIKLEHSLYSEKFGFQRVGIGVGYSKSLPVGFNFDIDLMGATTWNGNYQVVFSDILLGYTYKRIGCDVTIQPRYDSELGYETCWKTGISFKIIDPISFTVNYTTIPLYRMSEKRVTGGFEFRVLNLRVAPQVSVSVEKPTVLKNMRVLMSMNYGF